MPASVFLFSDALDQLVDYVGGAAMDPEQRLLRRAVYNAYDRIIVERNWEHLQKWDRIQLNALYDTGTCTYVHSTKTVTLSGGTFPSWAANGRILLSNPLSTGNIVCDVDTNPTTTTLTLTTDMNPGADVSTACSYTLFQDVYQLPIDFRRMQRPTTWNTWDSIYISPDEWQWLSWHGNVRSDPVRWTVMADKYNISQFNLCVQPMPTTSRPFDFIYSRGQREIRFCGYETKCRSGTVAVSAASTAVVGTTTTWTSDLAGSYIRFSSTSGVPDGFGGLNPYVEACRIRSVTDTTHLTLYSGPVSAYSGAGFLISDPIDLMAPLIEAFRMGCRFQHAVLAKTDQHETAWSDYQRALRLAMENDSPNDDRRRVSEGMAYNRGWTLPLAANIT